MAGSLEKSTLHVEGDDDKHALIHLLTQSGVDYDTKPWPENFPEINQIGTVEQVLEGIEVAVKTASNRSVGFVMDANSDINLRWQEIRERLSRVDVEVPGSIPETGFHGKSTTYASTVGVWLMPDNIREGAIETFLESLIAEHDILIDHVRASTQRAKDIGALFRESDKTKAVIRTWLAWQEEPGHPYGRAIRMRYFLGEPLVKTRFVQWFKQLFSIT